MDRMGSPLKTKDSQYQSDITSFCLIFAMHIYSFHSSYVNNNCFSFFLIWSSCFLLMGGPRLHVHLWRHSLLGVPVGLPGVGMMRWDRRSDFLPRDSSATGPLAPWIRGCFPPCPG
ncbi:hypothetical protein XENOCAPTIV_018014 [Xenoophorus captivus]|uniref:Uncharacterized protein n=1 Tax=Xenoophorus captivus TaxID=1517983 RepID=A0ABV0S4B3_9TELE